MSNSNINLNINHKIKKYKRKLQNPIKTTKRNIYKKKINYYKKLLNKKYIGGAHEINYDIVLQIPKPFDPIKYKLNLDEKIAIKALGYSVMKHNKPLEPVIFERRVPRKYDVVIEILYSGICHSDWHAIKGDSIFPLIPGHEMAGKIISVGDSVTEFKLGDKVGVGPIVDSCRQCGQCKQDHEQYCEYGATWAYDSQERNPGDLEPHGLNITYGGFSNIITVDQNYVLKIPSHIKLDVVAPLLCAGITTYSPLKQMNIGPGYKVGVAGIGGLGHLAIKQAKALEAEVVALTTTEWKLDDSLRIGADSSVLVTSKKQMKKHLNSFDLIIDTIPVVHDSNMYIDLLSNDGTLWILGVFDIEKIDMNLILGENRIIRGSLIGGIEQTQEMLDFCSKHNIVADIEIIPFSYVNETYDRLKNSDVKYRFVIDVSTIYK